MFSFYFPAIFHPNIVICRYPNMFFFSFYCNNLIDVIKGVTSYDLQVTSNMAYLCGIGTNI